MNTLISNFIVREIETCQRLNEMEPTNSTHMAKSIKSHRVVSQSFAKILGAFLVESRTIQPELRECLYGTETMNSTHTRKSTESHRVVSQCFAKILGALLSNQIFGDIEICECLNEIEKMKTTKIN